MHIWIVAVKKQLNVISFRLFGQQLNNSYCALISHVITVWVELLSNDDSTQIVGSKTWSQESNVCNLSYLFTKGLCKVKKNSIETR